MKPRLTDCIDELVDVPTPATTDPVTFLGEQFDRGLAWVHFPDGEGGLGAAARPTSCTCCVASPAAARPSAAGRNVIGYGMVAPTIVAHGTDEQKERFLRPLFTGEEIWCQLFSEPGAGSDVAGARHARRARRRRVDRQRPEGVDDAGPRVGASA